MRTPPRKGENPAVDYRLPGRLTFNEVGHLLNQLIQTGKIKGMGVTIFNPALDKGGEISVEISDCLAHALVKTAANKKPTLKYF